MNNDTNTNSFSKASSSQRPTANTPKTCGAITATGALCRQRILPCARHTPGINRRPKWSAKRNKMAVRILCGDKIAEAARRAGYSPSTTKGTIYRMMKSPGVKERIEEMRKDTEIRDSLVLDELIEEDLGTFMRSTPNHQERTVEETMHREANSEEANPQPSYTVFQQRRWIRPTGKPQRFVRPSLDDKRK
jgi:hypothetical protein